LSTLISDHAARILGAVDPPGSQPHHSAVDLALVNIRQAAGAAE
jgi:hypothetical protein